MKNDFFQTWFINTPKESVQKQYQKKLRNNFALLKLAKKKSSQVDSPYAM
jgi:hypothetical protein